MKISFMGGNQAAIVGLLTVLAKGNEVLIAVSYSDSLTEILKLFGIPMCKSINSPDFIEGLKKSDLLLSVHGREIVSPYLAGLAKYGSVNVHPYLHKYKGKDPISRALKDKDFKASVGAHAIDVKIDEGEVLAEEYADIGEASSVEEVYNRLYPYYSRVVIRILDMIAEKMRA